MGEKTVKGADQYNHPHNAYCIHQAGKYFAYNMFPYFNCAPQPVALGVVKAIGWSPLGRRCYFQRNTCFVSWMEAFGDIKHIFIIISGNCGGDTGVYQVIIALLGVDVLRLLDQLL